MNEPPPVDPVTGRRPDRTWDVLCHVSGLALFTAIPFGNVLAPLIIWLIKKNDDPSVDAHGKEALNFQISMTIYMIISGLLMFVIIGFVLFPLVVIADVVLIILASIKASNGELYRYPMTIRLIE